MDLFKTVEKVLNDYYESCSKLDMGPGKAADVLPGIFEKARKNTKLGKGYWLLPSKCLPKGVLNCRKALT